MHFATRVRRWRVLRLSWSSRFFMLAATRKMRASNSSRVSHLSFAHFALHPAAQTKMWRFYVCSFQRLYLAKPSQLDSCPSIWIIFFHNDRNCHLPKYWPFLLNEPMLTAYRSVILALYQYSVLYIILSVYWHAWLYPLTLCNLLWYCLLMMSS